MEETVCRMVMMPSGSSTARKTWLRERDRVKINRIEKQEEEQQREPHRRLDVEETFSFSLSFVMQFPFPNPINLCNFYMIDCSPF